MRRELAHQQIPSIPISVPEIRPEQNPTGGGAGGSVPSTLIDIDPVIPPQQVPTDGVEESLPSTSNPIIPPQDAVEGPLSSTSSDNTNSSDESVSFLVVCVFRQTL